MMDYNVLKVNLDALQANINTFKKFQPQKEMMGVIKANGYGCGDVMLARVLHDNGVNWLGVSSIKEAIHLREHDINDNILVFGVTYKEDIALAIQYNITLTVPCYDWCLDAISYLKGMKCHIALDTGMNRLGCKSSHEFQNTISLLSEKGAIIDGVFTHFAKSDDNDNTDTSNQYLLFKKWVSQSNYSFNHIHCDNTDASLKLQENFSNMFRVGLGLIGLSANKFVRLSPIASLVTHVTVCKHVEKGERVGYGLTHTFNEDGYVSVLPIGYDDGFIRKNQGRKVYIPSMNMYCDIVGRICMDQAMIFSKRRIKRLEEVEIFGRYIPLAHMAAELDTISYEVICLVTDRVTRQYYSKSKLIKTINQRFE